MTIGCRDGGLEPALWEMDENRGGCVGRAARPSALFNEGAGLCSPVNFLVSARVADLSRPAQPTDEGDQAARRQHVQRNAQGVEDRDHSCQRAGLRALATHDPRRLRHAQGEAVEKTIDWASRELEGFMRT